MNATELDAVIEGAISAAAGDVEKFMELECDAAVLLERDGCTREFISAKARARRAAKDAWAACKREYLVRHPRGNAIAVLRELSEYIRRRSSKDAAGHFIVWAKVSK